MQSRRRNRKKTRNQSKRKTKTKRRINLRGGITTQLYFVTLCSRGDLLEAQQYLQLHPDIDISANDEHAFRQACSNGHLEVAQWLIQISKERGQDIDISARDELAFRWACVKGHLVVAKWLLQIKPDINISVKNDEIFRDVCSLKKLNVAQWLSSLKPEYEIVNEDMPNWSCRVLKNPKAIARRKRENNWRRRRMGVYLSNVNEADNLYYALPTDVAKIATSYLG